MFLVPAPVDATLESIFQTVEAVLQRRQAQGGTRPVVFFDDIHNAISAKEPATQDAARQLCTWALEMHKAGFASVKFMTSAPLLGPTMRKCMCRCLSMLSCVFLVIPYSFPLAVSGFSLGAGRFSITLMPPAPEEDVRRYLATSTSLTDEYINVTIQALGAHMGTIARVTAQYLPHSNVEFSKEKFDGKRSCVLAIPCLFALLLGVIFRVPQEHESIEGRRPCAVDRCDFA